MKTRRSIWALAMCLVVTSTLLAQSSQEEQSGIRRFQITSLIIDGREVSEFDLRFLVRGREIIPNRDGRTFFVPQEVSKASWADKGLRFIGNDFDITFENVGMSGYLDSDNIRSDYEVRLYTKRPEIKKHLSRFSKTRGYNSISVKDVCSILFLAPSNMVVNTPGPILDTIAVTYFRGCNK